MEPDSRGSAFLRRVTLPGVCCEIAEELLWNKTPEGSRNNGNYDGGKNFVAVFNSLEEMNAVFGDMKLAIDMNSITGNPMEHIFICPFAHVCLTFKSEDLNEYAYFYDKYK